MMDLPIRHFKVGFNSDWVWAETVMEEDGEIVFDHVSVLYNFVVRGMKFYLEDLFLDDSLVQQLANGTWTGVVGLLNRSVVDYAPAALTMTEERWDAIAYNYPYTSDEIVFVTKKTEYSPETMALFRTLSPNVWLSLLACTLLVTLACFVAMKHRCTLGDILLHVLAICLNQEGNLVPRRAGEVLLLCTWTVAMAVFTFCFKSVLLSFLAFPPLVGLRTVPELAAAIRAGQYSAFACEDSDIPSYLLRSQNEDFRVIAESILKNRPGDINDLLDERPRAFVIFRSYVPFAVGDYFYVSKDNMGTLNFATAVSRDFCCKDEMDMIVHRYVAAGINLKLDRLLHYAIGEILDRMPDDKTPRTITVTDISGALIFLVAGHCLSLCVLIIECCVKRRERRHSSTRTT